MALEGLEDGANAFVQRLRCSPQSSRANRLSLRAGQRGRHVQMDRGMAPHVPLPRQLDTFFAERTRATLAAQSEGGVENAALVCTGFLFRLALFYRCRCRSSKRRS